MSRSLHPCMGHVNENRTIETKDETSHPTKHSVNHATTRLKAKRHDTRTSVPKTRQYPATRRVNDSDGGSLQPRHTANSTAREESSASRALLDPTTTSTPSAETRPRHIGPRWPDASRERTPAERSFVPGRGRRWARSVARARDTATVCPQLSSLCDGAGSRGRGRRRERRSAPWCPRCVTLGPSGRLHGLVLCSVGGCAAGCGVVGAAFCMIGAGLRENGWRTRFTDSPWTVSTDGNP